MKSKSWTKSSLEKELNNPEKGYVRLTRFDEENCDYIILIGERSGGKSFCVLERIIDDGLEGKQGVIIRRWDNDFKSGRGVKYFDNFLNHPEFGNILAIKSKGKYDRIKYYGNAYFFGKYDEDTMTTKWSDTPFCHFMAINDEQKYKGGGYPQVKNIFFDEFIGRNYIDDEFILFQNTCSTAIREKTNVKIYMAGNTINQYCPYFSEMGLYHLKEMKPGDFQIYNYNYEGDELKVGVLLTDSRKGITQSGKYFAFDNPKLNMIRGGDNVWEIGVHPHKPMSFNKEDIKYIYFIEFNDITYQCEIIYIDSLNSFTYVHLKTGALYLNDDTLVFNKDSHSADLRRRCNILKPFDRLGKKIKYFYDIDKVFYQDNAVGEAIKTYLGICRGISG